MSEQQSYLSLLTALQLFIHTEIVVLFFFVTTEKETFSIIEIIT